MEYSSTDGAESNWTITACILKDQVDLMQPTRGRQSVSEKGYFSFDFPGMSFDDNDDPPVLEVTVDTTIGYFELPNFANHGEPGPFVDRDPLLPPLADPLICQADCSPSSSSRTRRRDLDRSQGPNQLAFRDTTARGPLGYFTEALFGQGSYVHMQNYTEAIPVPTNNNDVDVSTRISTRPLQGLLDSPTSTYMDDTDAAPDDRGELGRLAGAFLNNEEATQKMLHAALLIATETFMTVPYPSVSNSIRVYADPGTDYPRPTMSKAGLILISVLVGILVFSLLTLSLHAATRRNWTSSPDALTLMRVGAELGPERLPMLVAHSPLMDVHELDRVRVSVGDKQESGPLLNEAAAGEARADVGMVSALGGARIDTRKKFLAYQRK